MRSPLAARIWGASALAVVLWLYGWSADAVGGLGPPSPKPAFNDYYNHLVSGFVQGHLHMDMEVSDALKALPDPYDPAQNEPHRRTDASYFGGRYYLYFGAAPAVTLLLPYRLVTGEFLPTPWAILVFVAIGITSAAVLFLSLRERYLQNAPLWTAPAGVLVIGIGSTADVLIRRPFFWELATAGGLAFSLLALFALYRAVHSDRRPALWLTGAGVLLGLAVASRPTFVYAVPILAIPLVVRAKLNGLDRTWRHMAIGGGFGIGLIGAAVFWYNHARFGNGFEFGHNYLLSIAYESKVRLFSLHHLGFNARMYWMKLGDWGWQPPYFRAVPVPRADMPDGFYTVDDPFGLVPVFPIAIAALAAPLVLLNRHGRERLLLGSVLVAVGGLFISACAVILLYVATIPRYAVDFLPAASVLTAIGLTVLAARPAFRLPIVAVTLLSIVTGTITFFDLGKLVPSTAPAFAREVATITSRGEQWSDRLRGIHYGPLEITAVIDPAVTGTHTLLRAGLVGHQDEVVVSTDESRRVRFGIRHGAGPMIWSRRLEIPEASEHRIRIELGSFYPPVEHAFHREGYGFASWLTHHAEIEVDGESALATFLPSVPSRLGAPTTALSGGCIAVKHIAALPANLAPDRRRAPDHVFFTLDRGRTQATLLTAGGGPAVDTLRIARVSDKEVRLVYLHGDERFESPPFPLTESDELELWQHELGWAEPEDGQRLIVAWHGPRLVWKAYVPAFAADPDSVRVGGAGVASRRGPATSRTGGPLLMRVVMPPGTKTAWQPLLAIGETGNADTLSVYYLGLDAPEFRLDHWGAPLISGRYTAVDPHRAHTLELQLPSFDRNHFGQPHSGPIWVRLDGREVLRGEGPSAAFTHPDRDFAFGENRARATLDDPYFRGAIIHHVWLGEQP